MLVWSLATTSTVSLAFDLEKVPLRVVDPHVTEVVVPVEPFEFLLKKVYKKTNGTVEGLRNRDTPETEMMGAMKMMKMERNPRPPNSNQSTKTNSNCYTILRGYSI